MNKTSESAAIEKARKSEREVDSRVQAEAKRLGASGSKDVYYGLLNEQAEAKNLIAFLESRQRVETLKEMGKEADPLLEEARQMQDRLMAICLKLAGLLRVGEAVRTNYKILVRNDEVKVLVLDEPWRMALAEKREEVTYSTKVSMGDVKLEKIIEAHPGKPIYDSLPYPVALRRQGEGKCKIVEVGEPHFTEMIKEDPEPSIFHDIALIDLGHPIQKEGKFTPEVQALLKKSHSPTLEISPSRFTEFLKPEEVKKLVKRFE